MNIKIYQRKIILIILAITIVVSSVILVLKNASGKSNVYSNEYYSLILSENCNVQEDESNIYFVFNNKKIATITIEENFQYGDDVKTIVANWLGMHSSIKSESLFLTDKNNVFHKVVVQNELSAAQEINGKEPEADEVHYFYLSEEKLLLISWCMRTNILL